MLAEVIKTDFMERKRKVLAFVGMPGSGKTEAGKIAAELGLPVLRFGQAVLDEALQRGGVGEKYERAVRNELRVKLGMGALAIMNLAKIKELLAGHEAVVCDPYSWDEYKILIKEFGREQVRVIGICAGWGIRHQRLQHRHFDPGKDAQAYYRAYTESEAWQRDLHEIEESDKGGPIAMADYYIINEGSIAELREKVLKILKAEIGMKD